MGASYPDLNRCNFLFSPGDRRCRNPIESPGAAYCCFHGQLARKEARAKQRAGAAVQRRAAAGAFFQWLCYHPLDTATSLQHAMNQVFLLLAGECITTREAADFLRVARAMLKNVPAVHGEFAFPARASHQHLGEAFLSEMRETLVPAMLADRQATANSQPSPPQHQAGNLVVPPPGPPLADADYDRNQAEFFAGLAQKTHQDAVACASASDPAPPAIAPPSPRHPVVSASSVTPPPSSAAPARPALSPAPPRAASAPPLSRAISSPPPTAPAHVPPSPVPPRAASSPSPAPASPPSAPAPPTPQELRASARQALRHAAAIVAAAAPRIKAMSRTG